MSELVTGCVFEDSPRWDCLVALRVERVGSCRAHVLTFPLMCWYLGRQGSSGRGSWEKTESSLEEQELRVSGKLGEYCSAGAHRSRYSCRHRRREDKVAWDHLHSHTTSCFRKEKNTSKTWEAEGEEENINIVLKTIQWKGTFHSWVRELGGKRITFMMLFVQIAQHSSLFLNGAVYEHTRGMQSFSNENNSSLKSFKCKMSGTFSYFFACL